MANLLRTVLWANSLHKIQTNKILLTSTRNCGWIRDWKPGPTPKTQEEREAAAKKYYLIPEDYEAYPEGTGYGDYPKLPIVGQDIRDPYEDLDYHFYRRNYGEMFNTEYEIYTSDRHNPNETLRYTPLQMMITFIIVFSSIQGLFLIDNYFDTRNAWPVKPKQYPFIGPDIHYTFEPLD